MTPLWIAIPLFVCMAGAVGLLGYWCVAWTRVARNLRLPTARAGVALARGNAPEGRVCVVVPAHDEQAIIGRLIESLRAQTHKELRVVLALDRCTDDTEAVARDAIGDDERFEIVTIDECPERWAGKVNAAWQGVNRSDGAQGADYLIFTDADCRFEAEAVAASVAMLNDRGLDFLSLLSTLDAKAWFEYVAQPAAGFELTRQYPLDRSNAEDPERRRPFANGQFMLFKHDAYDGVGGHKRVYVHLLEDIEFARALTEKGYRTGMALAQGVVRCRMYDSWAEFRRGWKRIYIESANKKPARLRRQAWRLRAGSSVLPALAFGCLVLSLFVPVEDQPLKMASLLLPEVALVMWASGLAASFVAGGFPLVSIVLHPIGSWLVGGVMLEAARDIKAGTPTQWGGRTYVPRER